MEDLAVSEGRIRAGSLSEYLVPTSYDAPTPERVLEAVDQANQSR